jgi:type IV secretory pathway TraG/TraD family ATPase VirD4
MVWGASDLDTQRYISDMLGTATVEQLSYRRRIGTFERAMIVKDLSEVGRLAKDEAIALVQGSKPIRFQKFPYTDHPLFKEMTPLKKYIPIRDRKIAAPSISFDFENNPETFKAMRVRSTTCRL